MSRLKYSMSDAFLKKFLRLERGKDKGEMRGGLAGGRGPHLPSWAPLTCGTARGSGPGGPAGCQPADLSEEGQL